MSLTYVFTCDQARCYAEVPVVTFAGSEPGIPIGWSEFEGRHYCPQHGEVHEEDQPDA